MQYHIVVINNSFRLRVRTSIEDAMKDAEAFGRARAKIIGLTREQAEPLLQAELRMLRS